MGVSQNPDLEDAPGNTHQLPHTPPTPMPNSTVFQSGFDRAKKIGQPGSDQVYRPKQAASRGDKIMADQQVVTISGLELGKLDP